MIDKAFLMMVFMYILSFSTMAGIWMFADVLGVELLINCSDGCANYGEPFKPAVLQWLGGGDVNEILGRSSTGDYTNSDNSPFDRVLNFTTAAAHVAWDVIGLMTGTYFFTFMYFMGVPMIIAGGLMLVYSFFLVRAIFGYIRGV